MCHFSEYEASPSEQYVHVLARPLAIDRRLEAMIENGGTFAVDDDVLTEPTPLGSGLMQDGVLVSRWEGTRRSWGSLGSRGVTSGNQCAHTHLKLLEARLSELAFLFKTHPILID